MNIKKPRFRRPDLRRLDLKRRRGGWSFGVDMFVQKPKRIRSNWVLQLRSSLNSELCPIQSSDGRVFLLRKTSPPRPKGKAWLRTGIVVFSGMALVLFGVSTFASRSRVVSNTTTDTTKAEVNPISICDEVEVTSLERISQLANQQQTQTTVLAKVGGLQHVMLSFNCPGDKNLSVEVYRVSREGSWHITKVLQPSKRLEDLGK